MSDLITIQDGEPVTNTFAIAAGTATTHEAVIKLVRTYIADLEEFGLVRFEIEPRAVGKHGGGDTEFAVLNEEQSSLLISYMKNTSIVRTFKKALIRGFYNMRAKLRAAPARPAELTRMDLIELALAAERERIAAIAKIEQLEHQVADQAPAVAALDLIANAKGTQCITDAAKVLQLRPHELTDLLLARKWMYHRPGKPGYIAYQDKLDSGHLKHKLHNYQDPESGEYRAKEQVLVTKKGLTRLAELLAAEALARRVTAADQLQQRLPLPGDDG